MNNVERFNSVMRFEKADRLPMIEWAFYWDKTVDRWYKEGLPEDVKPYIDVVNYFGLDVLSQFWIAPRSADFPQPARHGAAIIHNRHEYQQIKKFLFPEPAFDTEALKFWAKRQKEGDAVVWFTFEGFFWFPRMLFGIEQHMYSFYDHADLMHEMNEDMVQYQLKTLNDICSICKPCFMTFAEDMSYNHGPMLSKEAFDEFLSPYYKRIVPELKKYGILVMVDSDGDVVPLIPWLKEVGVEGILPLERMAGVDVAQIRKDHPDFRMIGAFDKTVMHLGKEAMRQEFERLLPVMRQGGFIPSVDHQTPPDVSIENYKQYVSLLKEYCIKAVV